MGAGGGNQHVEWHGEGHNHLQLGLLNAAAAVEPRRLDELAELLEAQAGHLPRERRGRSAVEGRGAHHPEERGRVGHLGVEQRLEHVLHGEGRGDTPL